MQEPLVLNEVDDVVLSDPRTIRALADLNRYRVFDQVQRSHPVGESDLAVALDLPTDEVSSALRKLADVGLVSSTPAGWTAPGRGLYVDAAAAEQSADAVRALYGVIISSTTDLPVRWVDDQAERLDDDWFASSGMFNARAVMTRAELDDLQIALEELMAPYLSRTDAPPDARSVRLLAYFLAAPG